MVLNWENNKLIPFLRKTVVTGSIVRLDTFRYYDRAAIIRSDK